MSVHAKGPALKKERVRNALLRRPVDRVPLFASATPQFLQRALDRHGWWTRPGRRVPDALDAWRYFSGVGMDAVQVAHPSFYPVRVLELPPGSRHVDAMGRSHVLTELYDEFCEPFPLADERGASPAEVRRKWARYRFPDPRDDAWFEGLDRVLAANEALDDPPAVWGVVNGPLEPAWQLLSDGWPEFFVLHRRAPSLAEEILSATAGYVVEAGAAMVERGVDAVRLADDYGLNDRLLCHPRVWRELVKPQHERVVAGLKRAGGGEFPVILHSDGNLMEILEDLAGTGIDALNPVQPGAMSVEEVADGVGDRLALAGAIDLRHFLLDWNAESEELLARETRRVVQAASKVRGVHGESPTGLLLGPTHQLQPASRVETFEGWIRLVLDARPSLSLEPEEREGAGD